MARQLSARTQIACHVNDETQVGAARRQTLQLAEAADMSEVLAAHAGIVATELASNMWKHARGGELFIQYISDASFEGMELLAVDRGPGIADVALALEDGHSTTGTPGTGLGAARRLSAVFDLHSEQGKGTVVISRIGMPSRRRATLPEWGTVMTNAPGETVSGDQWSMAWREAESILTIIVADGLGHGHFAHKAAAVAIRVFLSTPQESPATMLPRLHEALASERGAAIALARADLSAGSVTYAGIGNISGTIVQRDGRQRGLVSMNGTVGADPISVREYQYPWNSGDTIVMHTDGIRSHWSLADRAGLTTRHPAIIAGVLHRDFLRGRDDATVVALTR